MRTRQQLLHRFNRVFKVAVFEELVHDFVGNVKEGSPVDIVLNRRGKALQTSVASLEIRVALENRKGGTYIREKKGMKSSSRDMEGSSIALAGNDVDGHVFSHRRDEFVG